MSPLLAEVMRVHAALRTVRVVRRLLLAAGVSAALLVLLGVLAPPSGWSFERVALIMAVVAGGVVFFLLGLRARDPHGDGEALARSALWVEEQRLAAAAKPDFALTTAVEMLAAGASVPASLSLAASRTIADAPVSSALWRARRSAWQWPLLFLVGCVAVLLVRTTAARPLGRVDVGAGAAAPSMSATANTPLGAWTVRVVPPPYAALPSASLGDVNSVSALSGSAIVLAGDGLPPNAELRVVGADSARAIAVDSGSGSWRLTLQVGAVAQTARVSRGGRTRLLIVEGRADSIPRVSLDLPARDSVFREPRGVLPLVASAHDDIGLTGAWFELIVTSGEGERFTVRTVKMGDKVWAGGAGVRNASLRAALDLAALGLGAGDVVHVRAVARDAHPAAARELGSSETRAFRIARPAEYDSVAVEPAPPPEVDKSLLSQRMLLMLTEKLDKATSRMARADVVRESLKLARDQARLRLAVGDVVFQRLSGESSAEHAHSAGDGHDHGVDLQGGKLSLSTSSTTGMLEEGNDSPVIAINQPLLEAYNAMWDAGRALEQGDPHAAIPPMKRALEAIERSRAASRIYLRGKPPQVIVDIAKVRLIGKDTGQVTSRGARTALESRTAARDARLVRAAVLAAGNPLAARDTVALLRVEALNDEPAFATALGQLLSVLERGGDATTPFIQARRVLGNVVRTRSTTWSRGVVP